MPKSFFKQLASQRSPIIFSGLISAFILLGCFFCFSSVSAVGPNYFLLSKDGHNGNFGGLSGANSWCLSQVNNNNWKGKQVGRTYQASEVMAWLCNNVSCQNLVPRRIYAFGNIANASIGGDVFTTDGTGRGPGDLANWNAGGKFGEGSLIWTGRPAGTSTLWPTTGFNQPFPWTCNDWTSSAANWAVSAGAYGSLSRTDYMRWWRAQWMCGDSYANTFRTICAVSLTENNNNPITISYNIDQLNLDTLYIKISGTVSSGAGSITSLQWNWGDSATTSSLFPVTHTYSARAAYQITVTATDSAGNTLAQTIPASFIIPFVPIYPARTDGVINDSYYTTNNKNYTCLPTSGKSFTASGGMTVSVDTSKRTAVSPHGLKGTPNFTPTSMPAFCTDGNESGIYWNGKEIEEIPVELGAIKNDSLSMTTDVRNAWWAATQYSAPGQAVKKTFNVGDNVYVGIKNEPAGIGTLVFSMDNGEHYSLINDEARIARYQWNAPNYELFKIIIRPQGLEVPFYRYYLVQWGSDEIVGYKVVDGQQVVTAKYLKKDGAVGEVTVPIKDISFIRYNSDGYLDMYGVYTYDTNYKILEISFYRVSSAGGVFKSQSNIFYANGKLKKTTFYRINGTKHAEYNYSAITDSSGRSQPATAYEFNEDEEIVAVIEYDSFGVDNFCDFRIREYRAPLGQKVDSLLALTQYYSSCSLDDSRTAEDKNIQAKEGVYLLSQYGWGSLANGETAKYGVAVSSLVKQVLTAYYNDIKNLNPAVEADKDRIYYKYAKYAARLETLIRGLEFKLRGININAMPAFNGAASWEGETKDGYKFNGLWIFEAAVGPKASLQADTRSIFLDLTTPSTTQRVLDAANSGISALRNLTKLYDKWDTISSVNLENNNLLPNFADQANGVYYLFNMFASQDAGSFLPMSEFLKPDLTTKKLLNDFIKEKSQAGVDLTTLSEKDIITQFYNYFLAKPYTKYLWKWMGNTQTFGETIARGGGNCVDFGLMGVNLLHNLFLELGKNSAADRVYFITVSFPDGGGHAVMVWQDVNGDKYYLETGVLLKGVNAKLTTDQLFNSTAKIVNNVLSGLDVPGVVKWPTLNIQVYANKYGSTVITGPVTGNITASLAKTATGQLGYNRGAVMTKTHELYFNPNSSQVESLATYLLAKFQKDNKLANWTSVPIEDIFSFVNKEFISKTKYRADIGFDQWAAASSTLGMIKSFDLKDSYGSLEITGDCEDLAFAEASLMQNILGKYLFLTSPLLKDIPIDGNLLKDGRDKEFLKTRQDALNSVWVLAGKDHMNVGYIVDSDNWNRDSNVLIFNPVNVSDSAVINLQEYIDANKIRFIANGFTTEAFYVDNWSDYQTGMPVNTVAASQDNSSSFVDTVVATFRDFSVAYGDWIEPSTDDPVNDWLRATFPSLAAFIEDEKNLPSPVPPPVAGEVQIQSLVLPEVEEGGAKTIKDVFNYVGNIEMKELLGVDPKVVTDTLYNSLVWFNDRVKYTSEEGTLSNLWNLFEESQSQETKVADIFIKTLDNYMAYTLVPDQYLSTREYSFQVTESASGKFDFYFVAGIQALIPGTTEYLSEGGRLYVDSELSHDDIRNVISLGGKVSDGHTHPDAAELAGKYVPASGSNLAGGDFAALLAAVLYLGPEAAGSYEMKVAQPELVWKYSLDTENPDAYYVKHSQNFKNLSAEKVNDFVDYVTTNFNEDKINFTTEAISLAKIGAGYDSDAEFIPSPDGIATAMIVIADNRYNEFISFEVDPEFLTSEEELIHYQQMVEVQKTLQLIDRSSEYVGPLLLTYIESAQALGIAEVNDMYNAFVGSDEILSEFISQVAEAGKIGAAFSQEFPLTPQELEYEKNMIAAREALYGIDRGSPEAIPLLIAYIENAKLLGIKVEVEIPAIYLGNNKPLSLEARWLVIPTQRDVVAVTFPDIVPIIITPVPVEVIFEEYFSLAVTRSGAGSGTVTSNPAGIDCGSDCAEDYTSGASVALVASPASNSTFAGWSGACSGVGACAVSMTQSREVAAAFNIANNPPSAVNLSLTQPNYCSAGPAATFSWTFSDLDPGDTQSAYQIQADNNSDFSSPEIDSSKVSSVSNSYVTGSGKLSYNTTYYWRVKVWDNKNLASSWISGASFATPKHQYPAVDFSCAPAYPSAQETVQFADQSTVYGGAVKSSWFWTIPDANYVASTNSSSQNPQVKFGSTGSKQVTLSVTDSDSYNCQVSKNVNVGLSLPSWKEIAP